jgi:hypothetical protein
MGRVLGAWLSILFASLRVVAVAIVAVNVAVLVTRALGPRRKPLAGPLRRSEAPEPSRVPAVGTGAMALGLGMLAAKLAPRPEAIVWGVVAAVFAVLTLVVLRNPPITPKW